MFRLEPIKWGHVLTSDKKPYETMAVRSQRRLRIESWRAGLRVLGGDPRGCPPCIHLSHKNLHLSAVFLLALALSGCAGFALEGLELGAAEGGTAEAGAGFVRVGAVLEVTDAAVSETATMRLGALCSEVLSDSAEPESFTTSVRLSTAKG